MSVLGPRPWPGMGVGPFYPSMWHPQIVGPPPPPLPPAPPTCPDPYGPPPPLALAPHLAPHMTPHLNDYLASQQRFWYHASLPCCLKGEPPATVGAYKRVGLEQRESPGRDLPSKVQRQERVKERGQMVAGLGLDRDVAAARLHSKKSASTQTQFSSFPGDPPCYYASHVTVTTESYSATTSRSSFAPAPVEGAQSEDVQHAPLNLSMSSAPPPSSSQPPRPSVITLASANGGSGRSNGGTGSSSPVDVGSPSSSRLELSSGSVYHPEIEEHFRRSLGRNYTNIMQPKSTVSSPRSGSSSPPKPASPPCRDDVSTTGLVDEHFAKSLGSTWQTMTPQTDPIAELKPNSVDDHFTKSLGPTWLRIKAEHEPPSCNSSSGSPPNPSLLST